MVEVAKKAASRKPVAPKKSPLEELLAAVKKAQDAGIAVKGVYSVRNEDGTTDNGSLKG